MLGWNSVQLGVCLYDWKTYPQDTTFLVLIIADVFHLLSSLTFHYSYLREFLHSQLWNRPWAAVNDFKPAFVICCFFFSYGCGVFDLLQLIFILMQKLNAFVSRDECSKTKDILTPFNIHIYDSFLCSPLPFLSLSRWFSLFTVNIS